MNRPGILRTLTALLLATPLCAPLPAHDTSGVASSPDTKPAKPLVAQIPLPASAYNVDYRKATSTIAFECAGHVPAVSAEIAQKFKAGGWTDLLNSMKGNSTILCRSYHDARVIITIQPTATGSKIGYATWNIDWSEVPGTSTSPVSTAAKQP